MDKMLLQKYLVPVAVIAKTISKLVTQEWQRKCILTAVSINDSYVHVGRLLNGT